MSTILTQCPRCQTSFKVSDKQLAIAAGMVRCGSCLDVFCAPDNRITIKQPIAAVSPPENFAEEDREDEEIIQQQATPGDSPSAIENPIPEYRQASLPPEPQPFESSDETSARDGGDQAMDTDTTNSDGNEAAPASPDEEVKFVLDYEDDVPLGDMLLDESAHGRLESDAFDADINDADNIEGNAYAGPQNLDENTFHEEHAQADGDTVEHIDEETALHSTEAAIFADSEPAIPADPSRTDDDDHETLDPADSSTADDLSDRDDIQAPGFSALSSAEVEEIELTTAAAPKLHTSRDKARLREYLAELEDADALEPLPSATMDSIEGDPLTFEVGHVFRKYVTTFGWVLLSAGLLAALVLQVVANNLEFMQRSPSYSRYLPLFCKVLDCPQPQRAAALPSFQSQDLLVRSHPSVPDALEVSFIFRNDSDMPQAFPLIELSFLDSSRHLMANRLFKPEEYLPPELAALDEMPARSSVQVMLEMADPGSDAVNYQIAFRDAVTENLVGPETSTASP